MIDRVVVAAGTILGVGAAVVAAVLSRPRPRSLREVVYLALPVAGAVVLAGLTWARL